MTAAGVTPARAAPLSPDLRPALSTDAPPALLLVAPNDFEGPAVNLGAAAKIAALVRIFTRLGYAVHYLDSSHWRARWAAPVRGRASHVDGTPVTLWRPFMLPHRQVGKVLNVLAAGAVFGMLRALRPALVWVYNPYAFEGAIAQRFHAAGVPVVLEVEDLPLARPRGLNPKPHWDQRHFQRLLREASLVTFVNASLLAQYRQRVGLAMLLPSILRPGWGESATRQRFAGDTYTVGYFGGLTEEKGAGLVLQALAALAPGWRMVATGVGPLAPACAAAAQAHPGRFEFHGAVEPDRLAVLMAGCDVVLNPHAPIADMGDGVFPFKVCEAIASGALLLSTPLPALGERPDEGLDGAVLFFDGSVAGLHAALDGAAAFNARHRGAIDTLAQRIRSEYSEGAVAARLAAMFSLILRPAAASARARANRTVAAP